MIKIKKTTLKSVCEAARSTFPNEFIALIGSKHSKHVIDEVIVLPATFGQRFSSIRIDLLPFDRSVRGSVHSHPSSSAEPSNADLLVFKKTGKIHLIVAYPFNLGSVKAFNSEGKEIKLRVED